MVPVHFRMYKFYERNFTQNTSKKFTNQPVHVTKVSCKLRSNIKWSLIINIIILASLPYSSLSHPNGDPAPGRSPGPPDDLSEEYQVDQLEQSENINGIRDIENEKQINDQSVETKLLKSVDNLPSTTEMMYDDTTVFDDAAEVTTVVSELTSVADDGSVVGDACAFARTPSDSDNVVTLSSSNSDVNFTVTHSIFDTEVLLRGVVYEGKF